MMKTQWSISQQISRGEIPHPLDQGMPKSKIQAFLNEFPWITRYLHGKFIGLVYVSGMELPIIDMKHYFNVRINHVTYDEAFYLDHEGELVTGIRKEETCRLKYFLFGPVVRHIRQTAVTGIAPKWSCVSLMLSDLGDQANRVRYILSYSKETTAVIVYKAPKDIPLLEWIKGKEVRLAAIVHEECLQIDESR